MLSEEINASCASFVWLDVVPRTAAASLLVAVPEQTCGGPRIRARFQYCCKTLGKYTLTAAAGRRNSSGGSSVKYREVVLVLNQQVNVYDRTQIGFA